MADSQVMQSQSDSLLEQSLSRSKVAAFMSSATGNVNLMPSS